MNDEPELHELRRDEPPVSRANTVVVAVACLIALAAGVVFAASLLAGWGVTAQGTALAVAALVLAFALRRAFGAVYPQVVVKERRTLHSARPGHLAAVQPLPRRSVLVKLVAAAAGLFGLALVVPVASLGTAREAPARTSWRAGLRLVDSGGEPLRAADVEAVALAWPEGGPQRELDSVVVVRVTDPGPRPPTNLDWVAGGNLVAYSKICTHAGCPVGLFQTVGDELFCPCHQASFDAARGAKPIFGPAARPLPQLPLGVDGEGMLVALGDFEAPVGPYVGRRPAPRTGVTRGLRP